MSSLLLNLVGFTPSHRFITFNHHHNYTHTNSFLIPSNHLLLTASASASTSNSNANSDLFNDDDSGGGGELINRLLLCKDSNHALHLIAEMTNTSTGLVSPSDSSFIISAALHHNNPDLALSIFYAMCSSPAANAPSWKWSRPDVHTYTALVWGLAAALRVSDALTVIANLCRVGVSPTQEVPFGKIVRCPSCMIAVAVAQPQHGIQARTTRKIPSF